MMKFCPYCGTEMLGEDAVFCMGCGNKLPQGITKQQERKRDGVKNAGRISASKRKETPRNKDNASERSVRRRSVGEEQLYNQNESEDIMEMYAEEQIAEYGDSSYQDYEERKQYNPPVRRKRKPAKDYDGYYDDVIPYDKGHIREDNILDMVKKVFIIIIAALLIVAVCVVMMYIL